MKHQPHKKLLLIQKRIFRSLESEATRLLGESPPGILKYQQEYDSDFKKLDQVLKSATKDKLIAAIRSVDVAFISDFHTFHQAQRTALRLLRDAVRSNEHWLLGLEMISSSHQCELDQFQEGKLSLEEFHRSIHYREEWGFAWENYAPLFEWAKKSGVKLIALNQPKEISRASASLRRIAGMDDLHQRDRWAAGIITDLFARNRQKPSSLKMIVLYGELHVSSQHLQHYLTTVSRGFLEKPLRSLCVHQGSNKIYWHLANKEKEHSTEVLKLRKDAFCVLSSTPWAKLQSLISWAGGESFEESITEDYLSTMRNYGAMIAEFMSIPPSDFESLSVETINSADFIEALTKKTLYSPLEQRIIRYHVNTNQRLYIPRAQIAYLGSPSQNGMAELAAVHLQRSQTRTQELYTKHHDDFFRIILESTFGFLGSLVINPRRKCDFLKDHVRRVQALKAGHKPFFCFELESREIAVAVLKCKSNNRSTLLSLVSGAMSFTRLAPPVMAAARFVGQIIAKTAHHALADNSLTIETINQLCLARINGTNHPFLERYLELNRAIAITKLVSSKRELL